MAEFKDKTYSIENHERIPEVIERFASVTIDESLYQSALKEGISDSVIMDLVFIFGWDIDFVLILDQEIVLKFFMKNIFIKEKKSKMEILKLQDLKEEKKFFQR